MSVVLTMLRCPDSVPPETREVQGGEFSIGRGPENNWVLADPDRHLSKRHCVLAFRGGGWQLADVSTNGTYLNRETEPVGQGRPRDLRDGDRLHLGVYEIEVRIAETIALAAPQRRQAADPFGDDPFRPAPAPFGEERPLGRGIAAEAMGLPADFDPLAPAPGEEGFGIPTQSDHTPSMEDAFRPPTPVSSPLPDDWDLDLQPAARAAHVPPARAMPAPAVGPPGAAPRPAPPAPAPAAAVLPEDDWDLDLAPSSGAPPSAPVAPAPVRTMPAPAVSEPRPGSRPAPPVAPSAPAAAALPAVEPVAPFVAEPARAAPTPSSAAPAPAAAFAAPAPGPADVSLQGRFLRGAAMPEIKLTDPSATFEELGRAFRVLVSGLRATLMARAAVKGEFRIEQTMIRSSGNNPLKFSAGDDDALTALLGAGRRVDMTPSAAIADALRDLRLHELATMSAMQFAVRALLAEFDPASLRQEAEQAGVSLVAAQRKARAWDAFEKLHARIAKALADDFDSVFGKAFARAYEQALSEVADREELES